ncbi:MAG TPA: TIGR02757 family protein [Sphingobacteriaceae bacterium]|nr:TIGR02757 family protein [Sphingobacteriaceae bacterium]
MIESIAGFAELKLFLDEQVDRYNQPGFIELDPISIPHLFSKKQDIEIMGFFAAILAWGQRKTILNKSKELIERMDGSPYDFIKNHKEEDLKQVLGFKHRTFNDTDLLYFISFLKHHYQQYNSLEDAFLPRKASSEFREEFFDVQPEASTKESIKYSSSSCYLHELSQPETDIESSLNYFRSYFMSLENFPSRTKKHISSPLQKSTCKRLNMFLRWMVRDDDKGVDFGIWKRIQPSALICPCDVHVERVARRLNLIQRKQRDWRMAIELTENLRLLNPQDPVVYDFALFGLGVEGVLNESLKKRNFAP